MKTHTINTIINLIILNNIFIFVNIQLFLSNYLFKHLYKNVFTTLLGGAPAELPFFNEGPPEDG